MPLRTHGQSRPARPRTRHVQHLGLERIGVVLEDLGQALERAHAQPPRTHVLCVQALADPARVARGTDVTEELDHPEDQLAGVVGYVHHPTKHVGVALDRRQHDSCRARYAGQRQNGLLGERGVDKRRLVHQRNVGRHATHCTRTHTRASAYAHALCTRGDSEKGAGVRV